MARSCRKTSSSASRSTARPGDVDLLSGPKPTGTFQEPSPDLVAEKQHFGASRRARSFNR